MPFVKRYIFWLCLLVTTLSCNNKSQLLQQAQLADAFADSFITKANQRGLYQQILDTLAGVYPRTHNNACLQLWYYRATMEQGPHFDRLEHGLLYSDSLEMCYAAMPKVLKTHYEKLMWNARSQKGAFLFALKKYNQAYEAWFKVLQWSTKVNDPSMNHAMLITLGLASYQQKLYDKAAYYFKQEADNLQVMRNMQLLPNREYFFYTQQVYNNLGLSYTQLNKPDSAFYYYRKGLSFINDYRSKATDSSVWEHDFNVCKAIINGNLAKAYVSLNKVSEAIATYKEAVNLHFNSPVQLERHEIRDTLDGSLCLIQLAELYRQQKDTTAFLQTVDMLNRWTAADINHGLSNNDEVTAGRLKVNTWYYDIKGNKALALQHLQRFNQVTDSLNVLEKENKERNLVQALEMKDKQEQVNRLIYNNHINTIYNWIIVTVALMVALAAFFVYRNARKQKRVNRLLQNLNNEIKQQQKETQFAFEQMLDANKEKDKILHVIAHDLRNPLTGITTLADFMLEEEQNTEQAQMLQSIANAGRRSTQMVNELLEVHDNRQMKLLLVRVDLCKLIDEVVRMFRFRADEKNISLLVDIPHEPVYIQGDAVKLDRVVGNLLHNAIKFSRVGSQVAVTLKRQGDKILIQVIDHGIGMNHDVLMSLLNTGIQIIRDGTSGEKSYGLGWNICKRIIEAHHGKLSVASKENYGTCIEIELHAWHDPAAFSSVSV